MLRTDAGPAEHAYEMDTSELHRTCILMADLALTMNLDEVVEQKTALAERLQTIEKLYPQSGGQSHTVETLDRDRRVTEALSIDIAAAVLSRRRYLIERISD